MFTRIEATNYRCLKSVAQDLNPFEILVGANASGKSSLLDVVSFLRDLVSEGLDKAIEHRTQNFHDLVWGRTGAGFGMGVTVALPAGLSPELRAVGFDSVKYSVQVGLDLSNELLQIESERVVLRGKNDRESAKRNLVMRVFSSEKEIDKFTGRPNRNFSILRDVPEDEHFLATLWLRETISNDVRTVMLDRDHLALPSPVGSGDSRVVTGSTLARSIAELRHKHRAVFQDWLAHVRTALPDVRDIESVLRDEDKKRYIVIHYDNGVRVPSWTLSEGTLRLLALTILAYLPGFSGTYLIEEPENGVHPTALETIFQSLSSVYDAQVLVATHSPIILNMARPEQMLCFSKTAEGTQIVRGNEHPALRDWSGEVSLGTVVSSGILG